VYLGIVGQHKIVECTGVKPISNFTVSNSVQYLQPYPILKCKRKTGLVLVGFGPASRKTENKQGPACSYYPFTPS
jgi:hypothetical protein